MLESYHNIRIVVVGTSCSGKTTLARKLSGRLEIPHIEMDALYWGSNWTERPKSEFIELVKNAVMQKSWVMDGNYRIVRDIVWGRANILIWLNYPFLTILYQALMRTISRAITKEELFSGNRESFIMSFFSKESILLWVLKSFPRRKREYPKLFKTGKYSHLRIIELRNRCQADELIDDNK
ncbi:p-loop domain-containing protein [Desulfonema limicola]|uniref:P-loop domain-containing protein n=1 Tax=Desulfonema limicola TaxID=45656 RepID=A0A975GKH0_9BACT|nr:hypothetical protein [Desulfonema limicola]QTA83788.1 p-loop domain-containing protein [Desulfonema limicola]